MAKGKGDDDIHLVDSIEDHFIDEDGTIHFQVKWEGHESRQEWTWEPEENLRVGGNTLIRSYFRRVARKPGKMRRSKRAATKPCHSRKETQSCKGRGRDSSPSGCTQNGRWSPRYGSWENDILTIDGFSENEAKDLIVYVTWRGGQRTKHAAALLCRKCPKKLIRYLEPYIRAS